MTTTSATAGSARFIGRVGALAVALGIGVAITNGTSIASADTGGAGSSGTSAGASQGPRADKSRNRGPRKPSHAAAPAKRLDTASTKAESALDTSKLTKKTGESALRPIDQKSDTAHKRRATLDTRPATEDVTAAESTPSVAGEEVKDIAEQTVPVITSRAVVSPDRIKQHIPDAPVSPVQDIGLAALLGWSRREAKPEQPAVNPIASQTSVVTTTATTTLATEEQLAAEQQVGRIVNTPIVQAAKLVLMATWYVEALKNFSAVGGPDLKNLWQLNQAATEYANQSATEFLLLNSNDPKLLLQVNPPHSWAGQDAGGTRIWYDNPDTVYRFTGINGASTYRIDGTVQGYDPNIPSTHPTSSNANFSVLTGINGVTAANLGGQDLSVRDDGTFTIIVSPDPPPVIREKGMNYLQAPANSTILATRNTLSDWNTDKPMTLTIEQVDGPPSSLFSQIGGFAIPGIGPAVVGNPGLIKLVSVIPAFDEMPLLLSSTETALLMLVTGISGENTYMSVATDTGTPNTLSQPAHNAQFLSTQLQSAGYFQLKDDEAIIITVDPGDAEYFVVPVTNDWTVTNDTRDQQTSLNNSQAVKNADGTYTIVVSKNDPGIANWVSTGGLNQGTISMRFQGVDPDSTNNPTVSTQVVKVSAVKDIVASDPDTTDDQLVYSREQQLAERRAGYDKRYTV